MGSRQINAAKIFFSGINDGMCEGYREGKIGDKQRFAFSWSPQSVRCRERERGGRDLSLWIRDYSIQREIRFYIVRARGEREKKKTIETRDAVFIQR